MTTRSALLIAGWLLAASCQSTKHIPAHGALSDNDTLTGEYTGQLPCADCPGIDYKLELYDNHSFRESTLYRERSDSPFVESGRWRVANGQIALEKGKQKTWLKVGSNSLTLLDGDGKVIDPPMGDFFILKKMESSSTKPDSMKNYRLHDIWLIIELNGKAIEPKQLTGEPPTLELFPGEGRFQGHGGCNRIDGKMEVNEHQITFGMVRSTKMACPELNLESELLQTISNNRFDYRFDQRHLILSQEDNIRIVLLKID